MANQAPAPAPQGQRRVSPAERAQLFAQMTRQHWQTDGAIAGAASGTTKFRLNKVRLTNRVRVEIAFDLTVTHASETVYVPAAFAPFTAIRRVAVDMNNGFNPFIVSGKELAMYSFMNDYSSVLDPATSGRGKVVQPLIASSGGTVNKVRFLMDLPLSLNDRDPVSLIVTQNQQTNVDVTIDFDAATALLGVTTGMTVTMTNITVTPMQETFSVPPVPEARPDIGILKLVQSTNESLSGSGVKTIKLPTGMTYRKIAWFVEDASGDGFDDSDFTGNFEIVLNQSDNPYVIKPSILAAINHEQFRNVLPAGMYAMDFSYQGISNYGGLRDYVDTEQLTEFWLRFNAPAAGNIYFVYETLAKLQQNF